LEHFSHFRKHFWSHCLSNSSAFQTKPYDAKRSCWIPDEKDGFVEGEIKSAKGDQVTVAYGGNKVRVRFLSSVKTSQTFPIWSRCYDHSFRRF
jgi:myosin heavy chain 6/7